jgi:DNA-directed RNA polymerase subunit RPC12/RpoP
MDAIKGLNCPKCGGIVPIPEGQVIVQCPYCELRSVVNGERGLRRYQVPLRVDRQQASQAMLDFLGSKLAIARDCKRKAQLTEAFVAYLPFWAAWGRSLAWVLGEERVGSGDDARWEPREVRVTEEMSWNGAACDVGEFGVGAIPLNDQQIEPFNADALHRAGLVFEPAGSSTDAANAAMRDFDERIRRRSGVDRISQVMARTLRRRLGLVYYPLWVMRYSYRNRTFQVVVDGNTGKVLYGKAPGNTLYRAAMLVGGMALGALVAIDVPALILSADSDGDNIAALVIGALVVGGGIMFAAYRAFRYGEQYEYRSGPRQITQAIGKDLNLELGNVMKTIKNLQGMQ